MSSKKRFVIPAVIATLAVVGCSSDSDDDGGGSTTEGTTTEGTTTEGTTTEGTTTEGTTTEGTTTEGTTTAGSASGSFFNDDSGVDFANGLGGSISQVFSSAFSAVPLLLGGGTFADRDTSRLARAQNTGVDACAGGGGIVYSVIDDDATGDLQSASFVHDDCLEDGEMSSGAMLITFGGDFTDGNGSIALVFEDFTVDSGSQITMIDGGVGFSIATVGDTTTASVQGTQLSMSTTGGVALDSAKLTTNEAIENSSVTFDDFDLTTTTNDTSGDSSVGGQAGITTPEGSIQISMNPPLQIIGDGDFPTSGVVSMTASDGSSLVIDADSGDPATYIYTINDQGAISSGTASWADSGIEGLETEF